MVFNISTKLRSIFSFKRFCTCTGSGLFSLHLKNSNQSLVFKFSKVLGFTCREQLCVFDHCCKCSSNFNSTSSAQPATSIIWPAQGFFLFKETFFRPLLLTKCKKRPFFTPALNTFTAYLSYQKMLIQVVLYTDTSTKKARSNNHTDPLNKLVSSPLIATKALMS